jgi:hypothetical protein
LTVGSDASAAIVEPLALVSTILNAEDDSAVRIPAPSITTTLGWWVGSIDEVSASAAGNCGPSQQLLLHSRPAPPASNLPFPNNGRVALTLALISCP